MTTRRCIVGKRIVRVHHAGAGLAGDGSATRRGCGSSKITRTPRLDARAQGREVRAEPRLRGDDGQQDATIQAVAVGEVRHRSWPAHDARRRPGGRKPVAHRVSSSVSSTSSARSRAVRSRRCSSCSTANAALASRWRSVEATVGVSAECSWRAPPAHGVLAPCTSSPSCSVSWSVTVNTGVPTPPPARGRLRMDLESEPFCTIRSASPRRATSLADGPELVGVDAVGLTTLTRARGRPLAVRAP